MILNYHLPVTLLLPAAIKSSSVYAHLLWEEGDSISSSPIQKAITSSQYFFFLRKALQRNLDISSSEDYLKINVLLAKRIPLIFSLCQNTFAFLVLFNQNFSHICCKKLRVHILETVFLEITSETRNIFPERRALSCTPSVSPGIFWDVKAVQGQDSHHQDFKELVFSFFFLLKCQQLRTDVWIGNNSEPN